MRDDDNLITSSLGRLFKLGTVATRVGMSLAGQQALGLFRADPVQQARRTENFVRNALRVTEALGELKGAAMKVGQMLSVHEGLLPPEVVSVLRSLQKEAPRVSFEAMRRTLRSELPEVDSLFESLEPVAVAAASIGQVYRGRMRDGREVAVKIQYPEIDRVVRSDLKNLKQLFGSLIAMVADVEFDAIWEEVRDRLLEELDYTREAENIRRMVALHAGVPEVVVPAVVDEASTRRVLTMDYVAGLGPDEACAADTPQHLKDLWGGRLIEFTLRGLVEHRFLHADPNFANFGFFEDGRIIVYDHGCMKAIDEPLAAAYRSILTALLDDDKDALAETLLTMGVCGRRDGRPMPRTLIDPLADRIKDFVGPEPYAFARETEIYDLLFELQSRHFRDMAELNLPPDMVFVNRTMAGLFGNLCRLRASGHWREIVAPFAAPRS